MSSAVIYVVIGAIGAVAAAVEHYRLNGAARSIDEMIADEVMEEISSRDSLKVEGNAYGALAPGLVEDHALPDSDIPAQ